MDKLNVQAVDVAMKALAFELMLGCETVEELMFMKAVTVTLIANISATLSTGARPNYVKLYELVDSMPSEGFDPKMMEAIDQFKITIMDLVDCDSSEE